MCKVLKISRSAYYACRNRQPSKQSHFDKVISKEIQGVHKSSYETYGSPRIHEELSRRIIKVSRTKVARVMMAMGVRSEIKLKYRPSTTDYKHRLAVADNVLDRQFFVDAPAVSWVSNLTYISTAEGWLYLTVVIDLYDIKVIGWAFSKTMLTNETTIAALRMALPNRKPTDDLTFHSNRGSQYASTEFTNLLSQYSITPSISRNGNYWDNAVTENFFKTLKVECVYRTEYFTIEQAKKDIFTYIEAWYNLLRRHSPLNYATPLELEQLFYGQQRA